MKKILVKKCVRFILFISLILAVQTGVIILSRVFVINVMAEEVLEAQFKIEDLQQFSKTKKIKIKPEIEGDFYQKFSNRDYQIELRIANDEEAIFYIGKYVENNYYRIKYDEEIKRIPEYIIYRPQKKYKVKQEDNTVYFSAIDEDGKELFRWTPKGQSFDQYGQLDYIDYGIFMAYEVDKNYQKVYTALYNSNGKEIYRIKACPYVEPNMSHLLLCNISVLNENYIFVSTFRKKDNVHHSVLIDNNGNILAETDDVTAMNVFSTESVVMLNNHTIAIIPDWNEIRNYIDPKIRIYDLDLNLIGKIPLSHGEIDYLAVNSGYIVLIKDDVIYLHETVQTKKVFEEYMDLYTEISVYVNEKKVAFDVEPVQENDRVLVPMRGVFEALGAKVDWEEGRNTAIAEKDGTVIEVTIGSHQMLKNGEEIELDTAARMEGDRTLVPLRAVSETLGAKVEWEELLQTVYIEQ